MYIAASNKLPMKLTLTYKEQVERTREIELPYFCKKEWSHGQFEYWGFADSEKGFRVTIYQSLPFCDMNNVRAVDIPEGVIEITAEEFTQAMDAAIAKLYAKFQTPVIR